MKGVTCANTSRIPRPLLPASYSFSEALKRRKSKDRTKKPPSMIPRSKSRKGNGNDQVDIPFKIECPKKEVSERSCNKTSVNHLPLDGELGKKLAFEQKKLHQNSPATLKSNQDYQDLVKVMTEGSNTSYKDAQEELSVSRAIKKKERENKGYLAWGAEDAENDEGEEARQEKTIRNLYETIKSTVGSLFDNFKWTSSENVGNSECANNSSASTIETVTDYQSELDFFNIQSHYEFTLNEISSIWKNTIGLIRSVRDHAVRFVEENNKLIDREQLTLEAEMLQLALDFAISYSKLKTDFLIQLVNKRFNLQKAVKTELERFIDSKAYSALYSNDDLAAMAQTVQDLNQSLLKGEDKELELE